MAFSIKKGPFFFLLENCNLTNFFYTSAEGIRKRSSSVTTAVPKKGILKTNQASSVSNHENEGKQQQHIIWGQGSGFEVEVRPCCCCPQLMMHPDNHHGANYVSHCHTENSRWRPNVAVLQHQPPLTNETKRTPIALKSRKSPVSPQISRGDSIDLFHSQKASRTGTRGAPRTPPLKKKNEKREGTGAISEAARTTSSSSKVV